MTGAHLIFPEDDDAVAFVHWADEAYGLPESVRRAADEAAATLREKGWTTHGYLGETWCAPGTVYDSSYGCLEPDDPRVIAGTWRCRCGFETDRLAYAEGHMEAARAGRTLGRPGPHAITEIERIGPMPREWGTSQESSDAT